MYEQEFQGDLLYMMLYAVVAALNLLACCYLLFRWGNAFAPDITSPIRLRRWTATFFAAMTLSHLWYMPGIYLTSSEDKMLCYDIGGILDCMTTFPLAIVILFCMLQDRRRPLWLAWVMVVPSVVLAILNLATHCEALSLIFHAYLLLLGIGLTIYMIREVRRYGCWLRDNYADLEHKEIWQSFVVLAVLLLGFGIYAFEIGGLTNKYIVQVNNILLIGYLLWRVETLSDLSISQLQDLPLSLSMRHNIEPLLKQYCEDSRLYLQHDINITRLAREIGINRLYLSQYFSSQGMNYNAYINNLRINHFISLYHEAVAAHRPVIAQQLAFESGYQSYSTFRDAFKRKTGLPVTTWMATQKMEGSGES
ncbi:MAG: AraC family transcriptional regulator [Prevotella sp.]|nr:AraC family transcriptional regulator [Prevotella sp.]